MEPIGQGGMGRVWRAVDETLGREVAVKELLLDDVDGEARRRAVREARSAARLAHPNVVTVHDVIEEDGRPWIVMELLRAKSLQQLIAEGPLPVARVAGIGRQMLAGLDAAHAVGVLHRDVKPANVLVTESGRVVLTDFGIAYLQGDAAITATGHLLGSPAFMAPERLRGGPSVPACDLWSAGATLYAAVEGRPPFVHTEPAAVIAAVLTTEPPPALGAGPLRPVIDGLLRKDPRERLTSGAAALLLAGDPVPRPRWWGTAPAYAGAAAYAAVGVLNALAALVAGRAGLPTIAWFWVWVLVATVVVALTHVALLPRGWAGAAAFAGQAMVFSLIAWGGYDLGVAGLWTLAALGAVWGVWLIVLGLRPPVGLRAGAVWGRAGVLVAGLVQVAGLIPSEGRPWFPWVGPVIAATGYVLWAVSVARTLSLTDDLQEPSEYPQD
ncbi:hypothetical protein Aph01nite_60420 [Acrocarpospora phusangensis]|uniref:non-specific serine/threonine protein kinase n=2 Tax=Acrocarpospora phusangensis TaxID=1070424 RepID=A0A919QKA2_9ACTN|nr:hypothetical protein Aph01nite_60420 [Acrocarpospora phusangensis]